MKRVAGLLVTGNDEQGDFALLQRRGEWDYEHDRPESYPGGCQVTASGGCEEEDGNDMRAAMEREVRQELGDRFADAVLPRCTPLSEWHSQERQRHATFFHVRATKAELSLIVLHPSTGGLVRCRNGTPLEDLYARYTREEGVPDRNVIAVYDETKEAIHASFAKSEA